LAFPHHHYTVRPADALYLVGDLVGEPLLELEPVGVLVGDAGSTGAWEA
jgi:hypothetical protein